MCGELSGMKAGNASLLSFGRGTRRLSTGCPDKVCALLLLQRTVSPLPCADAYRVFDRADENFAVANLSGLRGGDNRLYGGINLGIRQDQFDHRLWEKVHGVFAAAVNLRVSL